MPPDVERGLAIWRGERLVAALLPAGGPLYGPVAGAPLAVHAALRGRIREVDLLAELSPLILQAADSDDAAARLARAGYEVRPTPRSALEWALR